MPSRIARGAVAAAIAIAAAWSADRAEVSPLTLHQMAGRAALVARVRAISDTTRRPILEVLQVFKGRYEHALLTIVPFRQDHASEKPWLRPEVFRKGREYVVFLDPHESEPEEDHFPVETEESVPSGEHALFEVLNAQSGAIEIPAEGGEALTSALVRFASIQALLEFDLQARAYRALLRESNPHLVEAGLDEVARFDLAVEDDLDALEGLLSSPRTSFRRTSVEILGRLGEAARASGRRMARHDEILDRVAARAVGDESPEVRAESARALGLIGGAQAAPLLRRISADDADQQVRYSAEVTLAEIDGGLGPRRARRAGTP